MHQIISAARSVPVQASQEQEQRQVPQEHQQALREPQYPVRVWSPEQGCSTAIAPTRW